MAFADFSGTYRVVSTQNFDVLMKALGISEELAQEALSADIKIEIKQEGDHYTIKYIGKNRTIVTQFTLGQEFVESPFGHPVKGIARRDGNRIIMQQKGIHELTTVRELNGDEMTSNVTSCGITSIIKYRRI